MEKLIGRDNEKKKLTKILNSKQAEFLAIYGRRRVGKTFLIREFFRKKQPYFELVGQNNSDLKSQLGNFYNSITDAFKPDLPIKKPENWKEAFSILTKLIKSQKRGKIIIFFDELPWLATRRSGLLEALDHEWNCTWSQIENLKLIVCGSAASWMLEKLIHSKGGLYNRVTDVIHLKPFTLGESNRFLKSKGIKLKAMQVLELYMVMGGIPYYLNQIEKGKSAAQVINSLCFNEEGLLFTEFSRLFESLFDSADGHYKIIRQIAKKGNNIRRNDLLELTGHKSGGGFKKKIQELKMSGFIKEIVPYGKKTRDMTIKIVDEYTLFYLQWIEPLQLKASMVNSKFWLNAVKHPKYQTWSGYAYEAVCMKHIDNILNALEIESISGEIGCWQFISPKGSEKQGAQIDMLIDRFDNTINVCEIKFSNEPFVIDKTYAKNLSKKIDVFEETTKTKKQIFLTMITTFGAKKNMYSEDLVDSEVTLDDLLKP